MDEPVGAWVREAFGIELVALEPVTDGADHAAELWRGVAPDGARYAVKVSGGGTAAGLVVAGALATHGVPGIAAPVPTPGGRLWEERDGRRLSLVPWVSDARALDGGVDAARWRAYGALLRRVHDMPVTDELAAALPRERHEHERWSAAARAVDERLERVAGVAASGGGAADAVDPLTRALAEAWTGARERLAALVARADALGAELRERPAELVVCHGDPHLGNLLLGDGDGDGDVWLIDWDDAVLAPRERDLHFAIGGVLPFAPVTAQQQAWFFGGYGDVELDPARIAYHRCTRALEDFADPAAQVLDRDRWSEAERAEALEIACSVLSPTGLLRRALSGPSTPMR